MAGFHEIIGHDDVVNHLQNAIQMGKISHAYIFNGEVGAGKKMLASAFAMALQCEKHGTDPCMECDSCKRALSKNHPDIITITHEKPNSIGIEDIRIQLIDDVSIKPYTGPYKIYILNEAEKLTLQAQNALLKTIEEPPAYAVILLLTSNADSLLPTISSRCVTLNLRPVKETDGAYASAGLSGADRRGICPGKYRESKTDRRIYGICRDGGESFPTSQKEQ